MNESPNEERIHDAPPKLMTVVEASIFADASDRTVRAAIHSGELPHLKHGTAYRLKLKDVEHWSNTRVKDTRVWGRKSTI